MGRSPCVAWILGVAYYQLSRESFADFVGRLCQTPTQKTAFHRNALQFVKR